MTYENIRSLAEGLSVVTRHSPVVKQWHSPNGRGGVSVRMQDGLPFPFTDCYMLEAHRWTQLPSNGWAFEFDE
jgi:hypothetical protein